MILHREGAPQRDDTPSLPRSVPELGRALRRERTRQGLRVDEVSARTGLPHVLLEALEAGTVDRLPDQVQTVKTLRGYAHALGLPGDRYALVLIDLWPSYGGGPPVVVVQGTAVSTVSAPGSLGTPSLATAPSMGDTAMVATVAPLPPARPAPPLPLPEPLAAPPSVHRVGGTSPDPGTAPVPMIMADTGITPAVSVPRPHRPPRTLRLVVVVLVLALLVGVGGLAVHRYQPQWLRDIGIGSGNGHHPQSTGSTVPQRPPPDFVLTAKTATSATFNVHEASFVVKVVATGGPTWIQASDPHHVNPIFSGVVAQNAAQSFTVTSSLNLQVGSPNARVFVSEGFNSLGFYFPQVAPFTLVFNGTG